MKGEWGGKMGELKKRKRKTQNGKNKDSGELWTVVCYWLLSYGMFKGMDCREETENIKNDIVYIRGEIQFLLWFL